MHDLIRPVLTAMRLSNGQHTGPRHSGFCCAPIPERTFRAARVVQEAVVNPAGSVPAPNPELPEMREILKGALPIESTEGCRTFELTWKRYVAYMVTEECVGSCGQYDDEVFSGRRFRVYSKSHFLKHFARDTGGHTEQIRHYKLTCLNHLIDIAAYGPPEVKQVRSVSSARIQ